MKKIRIALCGIGGYGATYLNCLLNEGEVHGCQLIAAIDPYLGKSLDQDGLEAEGILGFSSLDDFFKNHTCDLVVISSPIHFHSEHVCTALMQGSHVLCEKPLCATQQEAAKISRMQRQSGKTVTVGYQWSFDPGIQQLKKDCMSGRFGSPLRLRSLVCWPRDESYYTRNNWAGAIRDTQGRWILDSPVSNATGHFLHNMLYVLGPSPSQSVNPASVEALLFRANAIENYDTAAIRVTTEEGVDLQFYTTHASSQLRGPEFIYEFEKATIFYDSRDLQMKAVFTDGKVINYPLPVVDSFNKLWAAVKAAREGTPTLCGIEAAKSHVRCIELAQQAAMGVHTFPTYKISIDRTGIAPRHYVKGLQEALTACYESGSMEALFMFWEQTNKVNTQVAV